MTANIYITGTSMNVVSWSVSHLEVLILDAKEQLRKMPASAYTDGLGIKDAVAAIEAHHEKIWKLQDRIKEYERRRDELVKNGGEAGGSAVHVRAVCACVRACVRALCVRVTTDLL